MKRWQQNVLLGLALVLGFLWMSFFLVIWYLGAR